MRCIKIFIFAHQNESTVIVPKSGIFSGFRTLKKKCFFKIFCNFISIIFPYWASYSDADFCFFLLFCVSVIAIPTTVYFFTPPIVVSPLNPLLISTVLTASQTLNPFYTLCVELYNVLWQATFSGINTSILDEKVLTNQILSLWEQCGSLISGSPAYEAALAELQIRCLELGAVLAQSSHYIIFKVAKQFWAFSPTLLKAFVAFFNTPV